MKEKDKKQFGIWLDSHHAVVAGKESPEEKNFSILAHVDNAGADFNTSEKNAHNDEITLQHKYFKEILRHMQNAEEVHLTGTGTSQEQLMHFMRDTPQYKQTITTESTANKMSDEKLVEYIASHFNEVHAAG
jgi:stalled ribosome rescue protein Dom34